MGALLDGEPIAATPCRSGPILLPAGQQELVVSPGPAFVADGIQLTTPFADQLVSAPTVPADVTGWQADRRTLELGPSTAQRVLVVPESINRGWTARDSEGTALRPITVNGWQQGWLVPPGTSGIVTLDFGSNTVYRVGLFGGLALLPLLFLLAFLPVRRRPAPRPPARPWQPSGFATVAAVLAVGFLISGVAGIAVTATAVGARYLLRARPGASDRMTLGVTAFGLTLAGATLSRYPWRSVDGYIGHAWGVQLLALISIAALAASLVPVPPKPSDGRP